jgi:hypothetical protein
MCGNGVKTVGMRTMKMHQRTEVVGMRMILNLLLGYCAAVLGTILQSVVARQIATGTLLTVGTTLSVFGLLFFFSRIPCPLLFSSFALCKPNAAVGWIDFFRRDITLLCPQAIMFSNAKSSNRYAFKY